mgnify:CR=1 FL=1
MADSNKDIFNLLEATLKLAPNPHTALFALSMLEAYIDDLENKTSHE